MIKIAATTDSQLKVLIFSKSPALSFVVAGVLYDAEEPESRESIGDSPVMTSNAATSQHENHFILWD